ncbi:MAG: hypothetical protein GXO97_00395 [Nitrospirae bacterium]|nr:hypothetical protein [Nitrospirota bacterium]
MKKGRNLFFIVIFVIAHLSICNADETIKLAQMPAVFASELYPCNSCHREMEVNPKKRHLQFHEKINIDSHADGVFWCLDCHAPDNRDKLRLINGERIGFTEVYRLCGQCHGSIYRDWRAGVHGKRTGYWKGTKKYLLCTNCHNPHNPRFRKIKPERSPMKPVETLR